MQYVLITYYNRGTESSPVWVVYGHVGEGINDDLGTYKTESETLQKALSYGLPIMRGVSNAPKINDVLKRLQK